MPVRPKKPKIWHNPRRLCRYFRLRLMRIRSSPHGIALGLAIGVFVGLMPLVPLHTVLALSLAFIFKGSRVAAVLGTSVSNPLDMVPHYLLLYEIGRRLLPWHAPPLDTSHLRLGQLLADGGASWVVMMAGGLVVAVPAAPAVYWLTLRAVTRWRAGHGKFTA